MEETTVAKNRSVEKSGTSGYLLEISAKFHRMDKFTCNNVFLCYQSCYR